MTHKTLLLASFIPPKRIDWFLGFLKDEFDIPSNKVFTYKNLDDESNIIMTFKVEIQNDERLNFKELFPNAILIHKKGDALYTINALNKLIEKQNESQIGNIDYQSVKIDWSKHQNRLMLTAKDELKIYKIKRIF